VLDEITERALDREARCESATRAKIVGVHNAGILHDNAQRAGFLNPTPDSFLQVTAKNERDLQLTMLVWRMARAGDIR
jgi:hypothetical protein